MTKTRLLFPVLLAHLIFSTGPAHAQDFLDTVSAQAPTLNGNGAFNTGGATGDQNQSTNLTTGPGVLNGGVVGGRNYALAGARAGLLSPNSVDNEPIPSGQFGYGFAQPAQTPSLGISFGADTDQGSIGLNFDLGGLGAMPTSFYAGRPLPTVSTGSVDLNTVDCPFLRQNGGFGAAPGLSFSPPGIGIGLGVGPGGVNIGINASSTDPSEPSIHAYFGQ